MSNPQLQTIQTLLNTLPRFPVSNIWRGPAMQQAEPSLIDAGVFEEVAPSVLRTNYVALGGDGTYHQVRLDGDVVVGLIDLVSPEPTRQRLWADEPLLMLRASLSADCSYTVPGQPTMLFNRPEVVIAYVPRESELVVDAHAKSRQHGVVMLMNAERFLPRFGLARQDLPPALRSVLDGGAGGGRLITLPVDPAIAQLIEAMTHRLLAPALVRLAVGGALMELVALVLDAAARNPAFAGAGGLRHRDMQLAHAARNALDASAGRPPLLADLTRQLGTNQKTLKIVFRRAFGTTIANYCLLRRMRLAQALLLEGHLTIGQVADRVGYEHQSSFTAAFRAHAGMSPKEYQRHRPSLDIALDDAAAQPA